MLKNYLTIAIRSFLKHKSHFIINTLGLGVALSCCILAYLFIAYNKEFDRTFQHPDIANTFRVHAHTLDRNGRPQQFINAPMGMGPKLAEEVEGIKKFTRFIFIVGHVQYGEQVSRENLGCADSTFFEMFDFDFVYGDDQGFAQKQAIMLSQSTSQKFFGSRNPVGELMHLSFPRDNEFDFVVGGVFENPPMNSSLLFDFLIRIENFQEVFSINNQEWADWRDPVLFLSLADGVEPAALTEVLVHSVALRKQHRPEVDLVRFQLEHFRSAFTFDDILYNMINLRIRSISLIITDLLAVLILLIACFNLTNIAMAITARRMKEVGIRKVFGAQRKQIMLQFLFETGLSVVLALGVSFVLALVLVPRYTSMWGVQYGLEDLNGKNLVFALVVIMFIAAMLTGLYPAFIRSRLQPINLLKGDIKIKGIDHFSHLLVATQFTLSAMVLVAGISFIQNVSYQERLDLGYDHKSVFTVAIQSEMDYRLITAEVADDPRIMGTAITHHQVGWSSYPFLVNYNGQDYEVQHVEIGENYFDVMGFSPVEGGMPELTGPGNSRWVVVNEALIEQLGIIDPLSQSIAIRGEDYRITGVVENHLDNVYLSKRQEPFVFYPSKPGEYEMMLVRVKPDEMAHVKRLLEDVWLEKLPHKAFVSASQQDRILGMSRQINKNFYQTFIFLTILGGLLSASGVFALASLNVEKRFREIGIRKAMGASVRDIVLLLNRAFFNALMLGVFIGAILGVLVTNMLLDLIYTNHASVGIWPLLASVVLLLGVGVTTTISIIYGAAKSNPVDILRDE